MGTTPKTDAEVEAESGSAGSAASGPAPAANSGASGPEKTVKPIIEGESGAAANSGASGASSSGASGASSSGASGASESGASGASESGASGAATGGAEKEDPMDKQDKLDKAAEKQMEALKLQAQIDARVQERELKMKKVNATLAAEKKDR